MTRDEFDALKPGDRVRNPENQEAVIVASGAYGHSIQWGGAGPVFTLLRLGRTWVPMTAVPTPELECVHCGAPANVSHKNGCPANGNPAELCEEP